MAHPGLLAPSVTPPQPFRQALATSRTPPPRPMLRPGGSNLHPAAANLDTPLADPRWIGECVGTGGRPSPQPQPHSTTENPSACDADKVPSAGQTFCTLPIVAACTWIGKPISDWSHGSGSG